jgi:hypothetical protein
MEISESSSAFGLSVSDLRLTFKDETFSLLEEAILLSGIALLQLQKNKSRTMLSESWDMSFMRKK